MIPLFLHPNYRLDMDRVWSMYDDKTFWHSPMCPKGKCLVCEIRRAMRYSGAWACGHYDRPLHTRGRCDSCRRKVENMSSAEKQRVRDWRTKANQRDCERYQNDVEYRARYKERKRKYMAERYQNNPEYRERYNTRRRVQLQNDPVAREKKNAAQREYHQRRRAAEKEANPCPPTA